MAAGNLILQIQDAGSDQWLNAYLEDDAQISIDETSPLWDGKSSGMFSYSFTLNVERNRHILGNIDQMHGSDIYAALYGRKFRLIVCDVPFRSGIIRLDDKVDVNDGEIEIELAAQEKELDEILDGVNCRDIPVDDGVHRIQIGYSFKKEQTFPMYLAYYHHGKYDQQTKHLYEGNPIDVNISMPKAMVPRYHHEDGTVEDYVNVQNPYNPSTPWKWPFCNVRVCTQKFVQSSSGWEKERGYSVGEADRVNSAPCFYVPYFLYRLWHTTGIDVCVREDQLETVRDFLRLAMYHTDCDYTEELVDGASFFNSSDDNKVKFYVNATKDNTYINALEETWRQQDSSGATTLNRYYDEYYFCLGTGDDPTSPLPLKGKKWIPLNKMANLMRCYATSDNFPDADVSSLLDCVSQAFCARFVFDSSGRALRIVLMRNVLRSDDVEVVHADVRDMYTEHNHTVGFRLKYKSSSEIYKNKITGQRVIIGTEEDENGSSVDTTFNYNDYRRLSTTADYGDIVQHVNPYDATTYLHTGTGNAYRIKVDESASTEEELFPSLFEVGGYGDVEIGDCSDDDRVEEVSIGFNPIIPNDVNYQKQITSSSDTEVDGLVPKYAQFSDAEVHHVTKDGEDVLTTTEEVFTKTILRVEGYGAISTNGGMNNFNKKGFNNFKVSLHVRMDAVESYDISGGAEYPYDTDSNGITLGIMRGSGADSKFVRVGSDGEGNETWTYEPGSNSAFTSDSIDYNGNIFDYNGTSDGYEDADYSSAKFEQLARAAIAQINSAFNVNITYKRSLVYSGAEIRSCYMAESSYERTHGYVCPVTYMGNANTGKFYLIFNPGQYRGDKSQFMYAIMRALRAETTLSVVVALGGLLIKTYDTSAEAQAAVQKWIALSDLGEDKVERVSLKLKAEKKNPYHGASASTPKYGRTDDPYEHMTDEDGYFPCTGDIAQRRGLYDQFYVEYAYWAIHRKVAHITARVELADILNIDFTKKYRIGDIVGFINKMSYTVSADGLSDVKFEMYYL